MYLLDANVFIQAALQWYRFATVPGFWTWLERECSSGTIRSVSLVRAELQSPSDLDTWATARNRDGMFLDCSDHPTQQAYAQVAQHVTSQNYGAQHIAQFLSAADGWLIAAAMVSRATVVTHEVLVPANSTKVKVPNVCSAHSVRFINTFEMLDECGAVFDVR